MKSPSLDAVIFDMDNVLIDTRRSYLEAIRLTVEIYLTHGKIPLFHKEKSEKTSLLLSSRDVDSFKLLGGFNDDWDCCYGILNYLISLPVKRKSMAELRSLMDIPGLAKIFKERPVGVNGIVKHFSRSPHVMIEKISRIFQEIYLGAEIFEATENRRPFYWKKRGLIYKEKLIFKKAIFEKLQAKKIPLGIATGRPKFEAVFSLKHFGVLEYFSVLTTMDEVKKAEREQKKSLRKPNPFSLLETANLLGKGKNFCYVGDLPDDMLAAHKAKEILSIQAVAFPNFTSDPETTSRELAKVKPDFILERPSDLLKLLRK
jgi:phosphoglycolate phosphatase-like HAD superfamily hydrolase